MSNISIPGVISRVIDPADTKQEMVDRMAAHVKQLQDTIENLKEKLSALVDEKAPPKERGTVVTTRGWIQFKAHQPPSWARKTEKVEEFAGLDMVFVTDKGTKIILGCIKAKKIQGKRGEFKILEFPQYRRKDGTYREYVLAPRTVRQVVLKRLEKVEDLPPCPYDRAANERKAERLEQEGF